MTLLEMTVVILVLLTLIGVLFFGAKAWKRGSDRAICIMRIQAVQKGLRAYCNLYGIDPGATVPGLRNQIIGPGKFVESIPLCPAGGEYTFDEDHVPEMGELYMKCSLAGTEGHEPANHADW